MRPTTDKKINKLVESYLQQGWTLEERSRHLLVRSPAGSGVTLSKTPSDHRTFLNARAQFRRVGRTR